VTRQCLSLAPWHKQRSHARRHSPRYAHVHSLAQHAHTRVCPLGLKWFRIPVSLKARQTAASTGTRRDEAGLPRRAPAGTTVRTVRENAHFLACGCAGVRRQQQPSRQQIKPSVPCTRSLATKPGSLHPLFCLVSSAILGKLLRMTVTVISRVLVRWI